VWPNEWHTPFALQEGPDKRGGDYNEDYFRSSLSYKTPSEYEKGLPTNSA